MLKLLIFTLLLWTANLSTFSTPAKCDSFALPDHVYIKDSTQSFSYENFYALKDGKIWVKPNDLTTGEHKDWELFENSGVPFGKKAPSFSAKDQIIALAQEGLFIVAVSQTGRMYFWDSTSEKPTVWEDEEGSPFSGEVYLPPNKSWGFSLSMDVAPYKHLTPMHDIVSYYEDSVGNRIQFGFTATVYTLDPSGQLIRFWDTGLATSFSRGFATPERGQFKAESLAVAGSTIFVTDKTGKMYTRMFDYEMFGNCPALRFTWTPYLQGKTPEETIPTFKAYRGLPLADWRLQEAIPLTAQAEITTRLTAVITGKGNAARELRVAGKNPQGRYGYYHKAIYAAEWDFEVTDEAYDAKLAISTPPALPLASTPHEQKRMLDKTYQGTLTQPNEPSLSVELVDFYYYNSPAILRVHVADQTIDLKLHTFDQWAPATQSKDHPELIGNVVGEPKLLVGTLEIPQNYLDSKDPALAQVIDTYFRRFHFVHADLQLSANDAHVEIKSESVKRETVKYFDYQYRKPIHMVFDRVLTPEEREVTLLNGYTHLAMNPKLIIADADTTTPQNYGPMRDKVFANIAELALIRKFRTDQATDHFETGLLEELGVALFYPLIGDINLINLPNYKNLRKDNDEFGGLALSGSEPMSDNAHMNFRLALHSNEDFLRAEKTLEERIVKYKKMLEAFSASPWLAP